MKEARTNGSHLAPDQPTVGRVRLPSRRKWLLAFLALGVGVALTWALWPAGKADDETVSESLPRVQGAEIIVPLAFAKIIQLETTVVRRQSLVPQVRAVGTVAFDPAHVQAVATRIRGIVVRLHHLEGDQVKRGTLLAEISSAELADAQAEVEVAKANKEAAQRNAARETELAELRLTTAREAEEANRELKEQAARMLAAEGRARALGAESSPKLGTYSLVAALDGSIVERRISPGQAVEPNLVAFRVADLDHLWVELKVPEGRIAAVRHGDQVELSPLSQPQPRIRGRVAYVGEVIELSSRMASVRVEVDNSPRVLRVGQSVSAIIQATGPERQALVAPEAAVTQIDGHPAVFVALDKNRVRRVNIEVGGTDGTHREVLGGLQEGQRIVSNGVFALKSELYR